MSAGDAAERIKKQVEEGAGKAQRELDAAKADLEAKRREAEGPPAENADQAAQQVRDIRARLDQDLDALEARIPPRDTLIAQAKTIGGAAVAGVAVVALIRALLQRRSEKQDRDEEAERLARAIARHLPDAWAEVERRRMLVVRDEDLDGGLGAGKKLTIAALLVAAGVAVWKQVQSRRDEPGPSGPAPA